MTRGTEYRSAELSSLIRLYQTFKRIGALLLDCLFDEKLRLHDCTVWSTLPQATAHRFT